MTQLFICCDLISIKKSVIIIRNNYGGDKMKSLWHVSSELPQFEKLRADKKTDVLIIGGGITGILCAYMLSQYGINYILVEAESICSGITKNTTAKITSQHGLVYDKLIRRFGTEKAEMYLRANEDALKRYRRLCSEILCDFEEKDSYVYSLNNRNKIEKEISALNKIGFKAEFTNQTLLPFKIEGAIRFKNQAQFNPLKFISSVSRNLNIFENTKILEINGNIAKTCDCSIKADKIIIATHFPFINSHGSYFLKMYQQRSYVSALQNAANVDGMYIDEDNSGLSFRNYENLLLIGGCSNRTGKKTGAWRQLEEKAKQFYPDSHVKYRWATQDCMTLDDVPYIGKYSKRTNELYIATGFNKWGMTSSMTAAAILSDMVSGRKNQYAEVFCPSRTILRPQLALNAFEATTNIIMPITKRCPHMGCALRWNPIEHTWDCSCHGSRFTEKGKLINNPAQRGLKNKF